MMNIWTFQEKKKKKITFLKIPQQEKIWHQFVLVFFVNFFFLPNIICFFLAKCFVHNVTCMCNTVIAWCYHLCFIFSKMLHMVIILHHVVTKQCYNTMLQYNVTFSNVTTQCKFEMLQHSVI